ncbi:UDP-N-acetylglucosamine 2-epimerase [Arenimonas sp. MALMAid1274]|uniref:UDP-N-acetylglucosamine 2-epimerase n=1 Tax=Arenimonas sp. MALMAid1274 TaxID=3411630 RepID=UPI003BA2C0BC
MLVGTKAQFIKTAPLLRELDGRGAAYRLIYTGQHSETFSSLEEAFGTRAADDHMVPGNEADSAPGLVGWALKFTLAAWRRIRAGAWRGASWGVVHGDTASTLLSALALRAAGVRVAHVEAGLRSPRLLSPFPEEIVRRWVSRLADLHLAPDAPALANLRGVSGRVVDTGGNTLLDALRLALDRLRPEHGQGGQGGYAIVSLHRTENLGSAAAFKILMQDVEATARQLPVRFVLHPVTRRKLQRSGWMERLSRQPGISLLERTDYVSFVRLMLGARLLMTDGGSNQEEAAMLGLPTVLMRTATERPDGLAEGGVVLSRLDSRIVAEFVAKHAGTSWTVRDLPADRSPSAVIVDELVRSDAGADRH